jgi:uncharacterized membrane protein YkvA (DUF1232 family)
MSQDPSRDYAKDFTEDSFWKKLKSFATTIGRELVEKALTLLWAKGVIAASLGYLVFPADAIPDMIPGAGYADDTGALAAAFGMIAMHIKAEHKQLAATKANDWFGRSDGQA